MYLLMVFGVGVASASSGNNLLYLLMGMQISTFLLSLTLTLYNARGLKLEAGFPDFIFAEQRTLSHITLSNQKLISSYGMWLFSRDGYFPALFLLEVSGHDSASLPLGITIPQRGVVQARFYIKTGFPFRFFEKTLLLKEMEVVAYPALMENALWLSPLGMVGFGEYAAQQKGGQGEFYSLKEYVPEDDARHIFWKASAKRGKILVKEGEKEKHEGWMVILEADEGAPAAQIEEGISAAATVIYSLFLQQRPVGLLAGHASHSPSCLKSDVQKMLLTLALFQPSGDQKRAARERRWLFALRIHASRDGLKIAQG